MIFDIHNDFPTVLPVSDFASYLSACDGTVTAVIWTSELGCAAHRTVSSLTDALKSLPIPPPTAIEDIGFLGDGSYRQFDFSKYFYCSLTWNNDNRFAGGAHGSGGLTEEGRQVIEAMSGKCAVDLAHLNRKSFYEVLDAAKQSLCSHTGFADGNPRCLDRSQVAALVERKVPIGLCAVTAFTGARTVRELAETIDSFVQKYGADLLCIGTDFNGTKDLPSGFTGYDGVESLRAELSGFGYRGFEIEKILSGNARRFYEEISHERHL